MRWEQRDWGEEKKGKLLCRDTTYERIIIKKKNSGRKDNAFHRVAPACTRVTRNGRAQSGAGIMQEV